MSRDKHWGYHGYSRVPRCGNRIILKISSYIDNNMVGGSRITRKKRKKRTIVIECNSLCREYRFDSVSDDDRERLEREIGARFKRV